jgi:WD40 repeat protein
VVKTTNCRLQILISGGADSKIIVWDTATGERLHTLRDSQDTMMAVQDLVLDPQNSTEDEIILVSASSDPHIRRWRISLSSSSQIVDLALESQGKLARQTILEHQTSVYRVIFWGDDEDTNLWTASADGTAKCLSRAKNWSVEETYEHGDYVRAIAVTGEWVVTAGRDEDLKVWDQSTGKLRHVYDGHYEDVTGIVALPGERVVSVSIDGTVRTWEISRSALEKAIEKKEERIEVKESVLTAEEEAELAELMGSESE